jgi:hypothetical protein
VGAELFHADGQTDRKTDMTKLIVAFHNYANAPKNNHSSVKNLLRQWEKAKILIILDAEKTP